MIRRRLIAIIIAHCTAAAAAAAVLLALTIVAPLPDDFFSHDRSWLKIVFGGAATFALITGIGTIMAAIIMVPATILCLTVALPLLRRGTGAVMFRIAGGVAGIVIGLPVTNAVIKCRDGVGMSSASRELRYDMSITAVVAGAVFAMMLWRRRALFGWPPSNG